MKNILITGANGFLGQHLCLFLSKNFTVVATGRGPKRIAADAPIQYIEAELTDANAVKELVSETKPAVIIHTAAMSKPDECEANREACLAVNVDATRFLLQHSCAHFIYTSTDFVFGENGPHAEDDPTGPLNFYGESKLLAEELVKQLASVYTIVRPVFIYGKKMDGLRGSFIQWVEQNLQQGKMIKVVSDQQRTPTYVIDICKGIETIINNQVTGTFHLAGKDVLSPYDMAVATAKVLQLDETLIEKVTAETFPEPVVRAKKSGLQITKARQALQYDPVSFEEGVRLSLMA